MRAFVINLERVTTRRNYIEQHVKDLALTDVEFINAVDGKTMSEEEFNTLHDDAWATKWVKRPLVRTEIACTLSHLKCYERIIDENLNGAIILEDDAKLSNHIHEVISALENSDYFYNGVLLLNWVQVISRKPVLTLTERYHVYGAFGNVIHSHAYYVSRSAAHKLLTFHQPVKTPMDSWRHYADQGLISLFALAPALASVTPNHVATSSIAEERARIRPYLPPSPLVTLKEKLKRVILYDERRYLSRPYHSVRNSCFSLKVTCSGQKIQAPINVDTSK
jgi:glycosyl transferase family 25